MPRNLYAALLVLALGVPPAHAVQVTITAKSLWKDTGLVVHAGDVIAISAAGSWTWAAGIGMFGPDGDPIDDFNAFDLFEPFDFFSQARLIAYIGDVPRQNHWGDSSFFPQESGYFSIGSGQTFIAPYGGELFLGFNDAAATRSRADNKGSVVAEVTVRGGAADGPAISIAAPASVYLIDQSVTAHYSCSDPNDAVQSCAGPVADGAAIDTSHIGHRAFTVVATDASGNTSSQSVPYVIVDTSSAAIWPTGGAFEPTAVGSAGTYHQFYLTNPQSTAMDISDIAVSGDYVEQGTNCTASLGAHKSCRITVRLVPTARGTRFGQLSVSGSLTVETVPLWGIGTLVSARPRELAFGAIVLGQTSAPLSVQLTNDRTVGEVIHEIVVSGDFALDPATTCPIGTKLARKHSCDIWVTFTPTAAGQRSGSLVVHGVSAVDPVSVALSGDGQ